MPERDSSGSNGTVKRRRFLEGVGAAGVAAGLAGCGGTSSGGTTDGDGGDGSDGSGAGGTDEGTAATTQKEQTVQEDITPADPRLSVMQWANPAETQFNIYHSNGISEAKRALYDRFMSYNLAEKKFNPYAISDWSINNQTVELTVREGLTWHNGDAVTADDLVTKLKLDIFTGGSLASYVDDPANDVEKTGEMTATMSLNTTVNKQILLAFLQPKRMDAPASIFGEYVSRFENASSDEAKNKVQSDLSKFTIDEPVGSGPFQFKDADSQRMLLTQYEDHPDASNVNFPEIAYKLGDSNQARWAALINSKTDGSATLFMPSNKLKQLPDSVRVGLIPRHYGMGLVCNHEAEHVDDRRVRKAMAHIMHRDQVAAASGAGTNTKVGVDVPAFLTSQINGDVKNKWLDGVYDQFDPYEQSDEKAAQYLRDAGYEKSGGQWKDGDGNKLSITIKCTAAFSDWVSACEAIVSQFQEFGIDAALVAQDNSTYWSKIYGDHDYQVACQGWSSYSHTYPYFHFNTLWVSGLVGLGQYDKTVEVDTLNGGVQEVNVADKVKKLSSQSGDAALKNIQEISYISNQELPVVPVMEKLAQTYMTDDDWNVPPRDSDKIQLYWPTEWGYRQGWWSAKPKNE